MTRRELLMSAGSAAVAQTRTFPTVLVHEHVMVDFIGADRVRMDRYDRNEVFRTARPYLEELKKHGCIRMMECTPNFLGRDPQLLSMLSDATGIELWTNTGIYGAANHKFVPEFARQESAEQLAKRWITEVGEGWKPRFIKTGVNTAPLHELDRKLVHAAAITSRETGLPIASHTTSGQAALEQLEIIVSASVSPQKFIWVHAHNELDFDLHAKVASAGAWVEFDGINSKSASFHLQCLHALEKRKLLDRALISQDSGWYHVGEAGGGNYHGYTYIYSDFLARLSTEQARILMNQNPVAAFGS